MLSYRDQLLHDMIRMASAYRRFFGMSPFPLDVHLLVHDALHYLLSVDSSPEGEEAVSQFETLFSLYSVDSMIELMKDPVPFVDLFALEVPHLARIAPNFRNWKGDLTKGAFYPPRPEARVYIELQKLFPGDPVYLVLPECTPPPKDSFVNDFIDAMIKALDKSFPIDSMNLLNPDYPAFMSEYLRRK